MMRVPSKRLALLAAGFGALAGCSTTTTFPRADLQAGTEVEGGRVATVDGLEYPFEHVSVEADSVIGTYTVLSERVTPGESVYFEEIRKRHALPLDRVESISASHRDPTKTLLVASGVAAFGFLMHDVTSTDLPTRKGGGSITKPDPRR